MKIPEKDYYSILEIDRTASKREIRKAYLRLVKRYHPDAGRGDTERFRLILEAYKILGDERKREEYDRSFFGSQRIEKVEKEKRDASREASRIRAERLYHEGMEAYRIGDYSRAIEFLHIAANLSSSNPLYLTNLGLALSKKRRRLHEARDWCEKAVRLDPYNPAYCINLGVVYREAGLSKMAERYFNKALRLDPDNRRAIEELGIFDKKDALKDKIVTFTRSVLRKR